MAKAKDSTRKETLTLKGNWVTYRPEIRVLDCTIRDGGLMNNHYFKDEFVRSVYEACVESGVDYMEFGYKASKKIYPPDKSGPWKYCNEEDLRRIVGDNDTSLKLAAMADAERTDFHTDILPCDESVLDVIRVATYIHQIPTALEMVHDAVEKGYEVTLNLMAVSIVPEHELNDAIGVIMDTGISTLYLVDSFGAFYSEQIQQLVQKYLSAAEPAGKEVGVHCHNNQQLAYANTIEAIILGANRIDATFSGLGRGAGNCPLELLLGFLHNPRYNLRAVLKCIEEQFVPLQKELEWGFSIPYMLTGQLNQHPRPALAHMTSENKNNITDFFDSIMQEIS
jgi:4-hydroxy 2-oxovalerate aldolase